MSATNVPYFASSSSEQFCFLRFAGKARSSYKSLTMMRNNTGFAFAVRRCFGSYSYNHNSDGEEYKSIKMMTNNIEYYDHYCRGLHSDGEVNSRRLCMKGFDYQKAQLASDLGMVSNRFEGPYQPGNPIGFSNHDLPKEKIVVAVDVDEVLGHFVSALNKFIADRHSLNHSVSEYHVYEFFKIWNCSRDEADILVHEFFKSPYFKTGIHPLPRAQEALHSLSRFCNLSVVTSRQNVIKDHTVEWLEKHFPGLFQEIHFGNHFALHGKSRPKSDICRSLRAKVLIDDNPRYATECAEVGIRVLLFDHENSYPWCKVDSINQHPLVTKVYNWDEVQQQLAKWVLH